MSQEISVIKSVQFWVQDELFEEFEKCELKGHLAHALSASLGIPEEKITSYPARAPPPYHSISLVERANLGFRSRQLITTGNKTVTMLLPLNTVLGSHRDIDTVMLGVKHAYDDRKKFICKLPP